MRAIIVVASLIMAGPIIPALSQSIQPPGQIPGAAGAGGGRIAALLLRIDRLEKRVRSLTGDIEELQHQLRKQRTRLEKFEKDVDFRLRGGKGARPNDALIAKPADKGVSGQPPENNLRKQPGNRRGDAFDPSRQPNAVGVPRQLGTTRGSRPLRGRALPSGPLPDASRPRELARRPGNGGTPPFNPDAPVDLSPRGSAVPKGSPRVIGIDPPIARADANPRDVYRLALASLKKRRYGDAQLGFKEFLKRFPKSSLADDAHYLLGDAYARGGKHRLAAEQFLKVSTEHRKSPRAPYSLYRLGLALEKLGAKEQACASYGEVEKRYPLAPGRLRTSVERQMQRVKC